MTLMLAGVATAAWGQEADAQQQRATEPPAWVSDSFQVPLERDRAIRKLHYFLQSDFRRQPDDVAREMAVALNGAGLPKESRSKLDDWYARLLRAQIESWQTSEIRAKIRVEIARRDARARQMEQRLARIAAELAELANDAEGTEAAAAAAEALEAVGYVVLDGQVLTRKEAYPSFGITR